MTEVKTGAAAAPTALPAGGGQRLYWADLLRICATLLIFVISAVISRVLHLIPGVKKFLV